MSAEANIFLPRKSWILHAEMRNKACVGAAIGICSIDNFGAAGMLEQMENPARRGAEIQDHMARETRAFCRQTRWLSRRNFCLVSRRGRTIFGVPEEIKLPVAPNR